MRSGTILLIAAFSLSTLTLPVGASPEGSSLSAAPVWRVGDWWEVKLQEDISMQPAPARLVVAAADASSYFVGIEDGGPHLTLLTYHFPYFGRVAAADLSYDVHNERFHPVQFPLEEGSTWRTQINGQRVKAEVVATSPTEARIEYRAGGVLLAKSTYDAAAKTITEWIHVGHGTLRVTDHGEGYTCDVGYPPRQELLFLNYAMGHTVNPQVPREPRTLMVDEEFERAAIVMVAGGQEGLFSTAVSPPDGVVHTANVLPHDSQRWKLSLVETLMPTGEWHVNTVATDEGMALIEAIGFDYRRAKLGGHDDPKTEGDCIRAPAVARTNSVRFAGSAGPGYPWAAAVGIAAVSVAGLWFGLRRAATWFPALLPLYAKIPKERVLESRIRNDIVELLKHQPGLTTQEIRRTLMIGWGNTVHHLAILERAGLVAGTSWGHNRHWFLSNTTPASGRTAISALRRDAARSVFDAIKNSPGISQEDLAKGLAVHHSTVFFHVERLMRANLVQKSRDGSRVRYYPTEGAVVENGV